MWLRKGQKYGNKNQQGKIQFGQIIMAIPAATSAEGAATITSIVSQEEISKKIAAVVGLIINSFLNKDSCDLEETQ